MVRTARPRQVDPVGVPSLRANSDLCLNISRCLRPSMGQNLQSRRKGETQPSSGPVTRASHQSVEMLKCGRSRQPFNNPSEPTYTKVERPRNRLAPCAFDHALLSSQPIRTPLGTQNEGRQVVHQYTASHFKLFCRLGYGSVDV